MSAVGQTRRGKANNSRALLVRLMTDDPFQFLSRSDGFILADDDVAIGALHNGLQLRLFGRRNVKPVE